MYGTSHDRLVDVELIGYRESQTVLLLPLIMCCRREYQISGREALHQGLCRARCKPGTVDINIRPKFRPPDAREERAVSMTKLVLRRVVDFLASVGEIGRILGYTHPELFFQRVNPWKYQRVK